MQIADLFVRVRGDTGDVTSKLKGVQTSMANVGTASLHMGGSVEKGSLSVGKLTRAFETMVVQTLGVNREIAVLGTVLGDFAVGGAVVAGVIGGLALMGAAYRSLTEDTRKLREEQDKLIKSLSDENFRQSLGPEPDLVLQTNAQRNQLMQQKERRRQLLNFGVSPDDERILELNRQILYSQQQLEAGEKRLFAARMAASKPLETVMVTGVAKTKELVAGFNELRDAAARVNDEITKSNRDWWKGYIERTGEAIEVTGRLQDQLIALLAKGTPLENLPGFGTAAGKPIEIDIPALVKPTVDSAKAINEAAERHAQMLKDAIWGSAAAGANAIVSALNVGGGGKGSNLGGSLGATAGFAAGFAFGGPVGGAIGSTVGNVFGSLVGGLFDHKKAVNSNTQALRELTAELRNAPEGYKVAAGRYDATRVMRDLHRAADDYAARGGTLPWAVAR